MARTAFTANDGSLDSAPATVTVAVQHVGDVEIIGQPGQVRLIGAAESDVIIPHEANREIDAQAGDDIIRLTPTGRGHVSSINGGPGTDTLDLSGTGEGVVVNLNGTATGAQIGANRLNSIENVVSLCFLSENRFPLFRKRASTLRSSYRQRPQQALY